MELNTQFIALLETILADKWFLTFVGVWVLGFLLKEKSDFNNRLIPWALLTVGAALGYFVLEQSIGGVIIGSLLAVMQVGAYEYFKETILFAKGS